MESDNSLCGANRFEGVRTDPSCKAIEANEQVE